ncbi:MAG: dynamin family protein [Wolinella sp.]
MLRFSEHKNILVHSNAPFEYKEAYYGLFVDLTKELIGVAGFDEYLKKLRDTLGLTEPVEAKNYDILTKPYTDTQSGKKKTYIYFYPLILESGFLLSLRKGFAISRWLKDVGLRFKLEDNEVEWFKLCLLIARSGDVDVAKAYYCKGTQLGSLWSGGISLGLSRYYVVKIRRYARQSVKYLLRAILRVLRYQSLKQKHIAIISTMSSGKSTFINALIGNEIFPETQAACTAKITSIYDNDNLSSINGIALCHDEIKQAQIALERDVVKKWNDDSGVDRIILEGDLKNIFNHNKVVVVHDTPGTNFSSNEDHKKTTIDFLKSKKLDVVICLINAMYIGVNDLTEILEQVYQITKNSNKEVFFVLNKIDEFDESKEDINQACNRARDLLKHIGFQKPMLIATSVKAVRLFKMALGGMESNFSEDEEDDFGRLLRKFLGDGRDEESSQWVKVGGREYSRKAIERALENTSFHMIEKIINKGKGHD